MGKNHDCWFNFGLDGSVVDCNFFFDSEGKARTEDQILVHNIFLYKISRKVDKEDAKVYFEKFGEIKKFHFIVKKAPGRRRGSRVGFIHFKEAKSAATVLKLRCHKLGESKSVWVKACDSWHQPHDSCSSIIDEQQNEEAGNDISDEIAIQKTGSSISKLDDDCLYVIFKTMHLRDQVNFACSHPRFASIFKLYAKLYYKTVQTDEFETLSLWNIRQFLILAGQFIEIFTGTFQHKYRDRIVNFIKVHCPNIHKIKLDTTRMKLTSLQKLITNKPKLTTLNLVDCGIDDHGMYAISKLTQLESLVISRSSNFTGHHLSSLKNLRKLRLVCCGFLQPSFLLKALSSMPCLRFLDLSGSQQLCKKVFEKLPLLCTNLEVLQISCNDLVYDSIAKIPKLKNLSLSTRYPMLLRIELLQQLVKEKSQQLEFLQILPLLHVKLEHCEYISKLEKLKKLHFSPSPDVDDRCLSVLSELKELEELKISGCKNITNDGLLQMVLQCKKLKWVNIQRTDISNNFAHRLIHYLKTSERPNGCITFLCAGSKMTKLGLVEDYNSINISSLVQFEFNLPKTLASYDHLSDAFESNDLVMDVPFFHVDNVYQSDSDEDDSNDDLSFLNANIGFDDIDEFDAEMVIW